MAASACCRSNLLTKVVMLGDCEGSGSKIFPVLIRGLAAGMNGEGKEDDR